MLGTIVPIRHRQGRWGWVSHLFSLGCAVVFLLFQLGVARVLTGWCCLTLRKSGGVAPPTSHLHLFSSFISFRAVFDSISVYEPQICERKSPPPRRRRRESSTTLKEEDTATPPNRMSGTQHHRRGGRGEAIQSRRMRKAAPLQGRREVSTTQFEKGTVAPSERWRRKAAPHQRRGASHLTVCV